MSVLGHLQPASVMRYFEEICAIPHGSGNTKAISDYCVDFAKARDLEYRQDSVNNVIIIKPASVGYESAPAVILQGHIDMVCEKEANCPIDMEKDGLCLATDDEWIWAEGTTLGGDDGIAVAMGCRYAASADYSASMGMFVVKRTKLIEAINDLVPRGNYHFERDFIMNCWNKGELKLNVYNFQGVSLFNKSVETYYKNNMALLDADVRNSLFRGEVPIYTKVRDEVPTLYGKNADVGNVIVADGCRLNGKIENSVIFREVKVEEGAEVKDAIVMQGCTIEKGASVQYTILDKDVTVKSGTKLLGSAEHPLIIRKGVTV